MSCDVKDGDGFCYYASASEIGEDGRTRVPWRKLALGCSSSPVFDNLPLRTWEEVRYVLELQQGMHVSGKCVSFLSAMRRAAYKDAGNKWDAALRLKSADVIKDKDAIVLFRRPVPRALRLHIPSRFDPEIIKERKRLEAEEEQRLSRLRQRNYEMEEKFKHMTESERIAAVLAGTDTEDMFPVAIVRQQIEPVGRRRKDAASMHPDEYEYCKNAPVPPESYTCSGCNEAGLHFRADCPRTLETRVVIDTGHTIVNLSPEVDKISTSLGIPKMFLKKVNLGGDSGATATTKNENGPLQSQRALTTLDGEVVVVERATSTHITVEREEVLSRLDAQPHRYGVQQNDDGDELYFDFEPYMNAHDDVYAEKLEKVYVAFPHLRRKLQSMCTHWMRGICHKGILCEYLHVYSMAGMPICKFYLQGKCTNDECTFQHTLPPSAEGHKRVRTRRPCLSYAVGFCHLGPRCPDVHMRRDHPYIADFPENEALFHAVVSAFDAFTKVINKNAHREKYGLTRTAAKRLHESVQKVISGSKRTRVAAAAAKDDNDIF